MISNLRYSIFFFFIISCSNEQSTPSEKPNNASIIETAVDYDYKFDKKFTELRQLYDDYCNKHCNDGIFYTNEPMQDINLYKEIENYFYSMEKGIRELEVIILENDEFQQHINLNYNQYYNDVFGLLFSYASEIGYQIVDLDSKTPLLLDKRINYSDFRESYIAVHDKSAKYFSWYRDGQQDIDNDIRDKLIESYGRMIDMSEQNERKKWDDIVFMLFNHNSESASSIYFDLLGDYLIDSEFEQLYSISQPLKILANDFNIKSRAIRRNQNNNDTSYRIPLRFVWDIRQTNIKSEQLLLIDTLGFMINAITSEQMISRGYGTESEIYLDRSIRHLNDINLAALTSVIDEDNTDFLRLMQVSLSNMFSSIERNAETASMRKDKERYIEFIEKKFDDIENLNDYKKLFEYYVYENFDEQDLAFTKYNLDYEIKKIEALIEFGFDITSYECSVNNRKCKKEQRELDFLFNKANIPQKEYDNASLDKPLDTYDLLAWEDHIGILQERFSEENKHLSDHSYNKKWVEEFASGVSREALNGIFENITVLDIKNNPEAYKDHMGFLKDLIINGEIIQALNIDLDRFSSSKSLFNLKRDKEFYLELFILDKISKIMESDLGDVFVLNYLRDIYDEYNTNNNFIADILTYSDIQIVYTLMTEEDNNTVGGYAFYVLKRSFMNENKLRIEKVVSSDDWHNEELIFDFGIINMLIKDEANKENSSIRHSNKESSLYAMQQKLYKKIINPIDSSLERGDPIVFILDPLMESIPFEALRDEDGHYISNYYPMTRFTSLESFVTSTQHLIETKDTRDQRMNNFQRFWGATDDIYTPRLLAIGGVDYKNKTNDYNVTRGGSSLKQLPWTLSEVRSIDKRIRYTTILTGDRATETSIKNQNFNKYQVLHFATHGMPRYSDYKKSALLLVEDEENDGSLTFDEITKLKLENIDTVFLSACETNTARIFKNITSPSLQRAFNIAGANNVISTLWVIDDKATSYFVDIYYDELRKDGISIFSLHKARKRFIKTYPEYSHPYYWAAFAHYGF